MYNIMGRLRAQPQLSDTLSKGGAMQGLLPFLGGRLGGSGRMGMMANIMRDFVRKKQRKGNLRPTSWQPGDKPSPMGPGWGVGMTPMPDMQAGGPSMPGYSLGGSPAFGGIRPVRPMEDEGMFIRNPFGSYPGVM